MAIHSVQIPHHQKQTCQVTLDLHRFSLHKLHVNMLCFRFTIKKVFPLQQGLTVVARGIKFTTHFLKTIWVAAKPTARPSGSASFCDSYDRQIDGSTSTPMQALLSHLWIKCFTIINPAWRIPQAAN